MQSVLLRRLEPQDIEELYRFRNAPDVLAALGGHSTGYSRQDLAEWLNHHRGRPDEVLWAIASPGDNRCIGHVGLYQIDHRIRKAEFAILVGDPDWRGKGVGYDVTRRVIRYGFDELNLHKIDLTVVDTNQAAISLYKKLGFVIDGKLRDEQFRNGSYINLLLMSVLENEWQSSDA